MTISKSVSISKIATHIDNVNFESNIGQLKNLRLHPYFGKEIYKVP